MKTKSLDEINPVTQRILMDTLIEFWEQVAFPMIDQKAEKIDVTKKITALQTDVKDIKRRLINLESNLPNSKDIKSLDKRLTVLEYQNLN